MTEREKLMELVDGGLKAYGKSNECAKVISFLADYLLKNGAYVPLVNENDTVYIVLLNKVIPFNIIQVNLYQDHFYYKGLHGLCLSYTFRTSDINKTVFLTREEAEKALEERSG